jgi:hypothetical protein
MSAEMVSKQKPSVYGLETIDVNVRVWSTQGMRAVAAQTCEVKVSVFGRCGANRFAVCQYCGRPFCERHGTVFNDEQGLRQEVCTRKECVAKREDLARHLIYRASVLTRNETESCGIVDCSVELAAQCVRCKGYFCESHARRREDSLIENQVKIHRMANLCHHCTDRRAIWTRQ